MRLLRPLVGLALVLYGIPALIFSFLAFTWTYDSFITYRADPIGIVLASGAVVIGSWLLGIRISR